MTDLSEKPKEKKRKLEDTDATSYFETSNKIKRVAVPAPKPKTKPVKKAQEYDDDFIVDDDDFDFDDDVMKEIEVPQSTKIATNTNGTKVNGKEPMAAKTASPKTVKKEDRKPAPAPAKRKADEVSSGEDEFMEPKPVRKTDRSSRSTPKKAKVAETVKEEPLAKSPAKPPVKTAPRTPKAVKKQEANEEEEDTERKAILENVETVALPDVEPSKGESKYLSLLSCPNSDSITAQW